MFERCLSTESVGSQVAEATRNSPGSGLWVCHGLATPTTKSCGSAGGVGILQASQEVPEHGGADAAPGQAAVKGCQACTMVFHVTSLVLVRKSLGRAFDLGRGLEALDFLALCSTAFVPIGRSALSV